MTPAEMSPTSRASFAVKPASWPKLLVPCALGQAMGVREAGHGAIAPALVGLAFTVFGLLFIVLLNDYVDRDVDALKRAMFPETSKKTIADGVLSAQTLRLVGAAAGALSLASAVVGERLVARPGLGLAGVLGVGVFAAYSMPPLRLNYRGGGELLEAFGIGALLPWFNAYVQSGVPRPAPLVLLPGVALWALASALASGLSDEESDRRGGKVTFTTLLGNHAVRRGVTACLVGGAVLLAFSPWTARGTPPTLPMWVTLPPAVVVLASTPAIVRSGRLAVTNAFSAQSAYKGLLHRACWRGSLLLAVLLVLSTLATLR